jgi:hypothetical protein
MVLKLLPYILQFRFLYSRLQPGRGCVLIERASFTCSTNLSLAVNILLDLEFLPPALAFLELDLPAHVFLRAIKTYLKQCVLTIGGTSLVLFGWLRTTEKSFDKSPFFVLAD